MLKSEVEPVSDKFFQNDNALCMFDPDTFKVYRYDAGRWVESDDLELREDIRFHSIELSRKEALERACGCCAGTGQRGKRVLSLSSRDRSPSTVYFPLMKACWPSSSPAATATHTSAGVRTTMPGAAAGPS